MPEGRKEVRWEKRVNQKRACRRQEDGGKDWGGDEEGTNTGAG